MQGGNCYPGLFFVARMPVKLCHEMQKFTAGHEVRRVEALRQEREPCTGNGFPMIDTEKANATGLGIAEVEHAFDQRGFPRPIFTNQPEEFPLPDRERYIVQCETPSVFLAQCLDAQSRYLGVGHAVFRCF